MIAGDLHTDESELDGPLLFARALDGGGGGRALGWDAARRWRPSRAEPVLWVHLCRHLPGVAEWLEEGLQVSGPTAELLVGDDSRPRALREGQALVAVLRGINFNPGAEPEDMVSMQVWSDGRRVVSLRRHKLQTPRDTLSEIDAGEGPVDAGALVASLVEHLIGRMNRSIVDMNLAIDELEASDPDDNTKPKLARIAAIRRNCLALKRHMAPQHDALEAIVHDAPKWFDEPDRRAIGESIERLRRYLDDLDISKESALVLQDEVRARSLARSERTSYLLTIVAAVFLPLTFLTGLLGINVGGMPGVEDDRAFWIVVALCTVLLVLTLILFRRWKWL